MINVIVVPETEQFKMDVSHENVVWVTRNLGIPDLEGRNAKYFAPYWITDKFRGVNRVFHIEDFFTYEKVSEIYLGNSFIIPLWNKMGQYRRFEYHSLDSFGLKEIQPGILNTL